MRFCAFLVLACLPASAAVAQTPAPAFEVASIKPSAPNTQRGGFGMSPSGLFQVQGLSVAEMIQAAYSQGRPFYRFQMTGGPEWLDSARFDINASSTLRSPTTPQLMGMVKALLVDRFKLVIREETRDAPIYLLTLVKRDGSLGPKMRKSLLTCPSGAMAPPAPGDAPNQCEYRVGYGKLTARGLPVERLAFSMANFYGIGRLVVDRTGLTGGYDMDMEWAPLTQFRQPGNLDPPPDAADRPVNDGPTIFVALREQLGLTLESSRGPVPMLVIERVEKPSEN